MARMSKNSFDARAGPLPGFVGAEWAKSQIGVGAASRQRAIAEELAKKYAHWGGAEEGDEFYGKIAQDLAIPGFVDAVLEASPGKGKKTKKPPFWFIFERIMSQAGGVPKGRFKAACERAVENARQKEQWENLADFAFFAALWLRNPDEILPAVRGTPVEAQLADFLADFAEKSAGEKSAHREQMLEESRERWRALMQKLAAEIKTWEEDPHPRALLRMREYEEEMEDALRAYAGIREKAAKAKVGALLKEGAETLEPFAKDAAIAPLRDKLLQLSEDGEGAAPEVMAGIGADGEGFSGALQALAAMVVCRQQMEKEAARAAAEGKTDAAAKIGAQADKARSDIQSAAARMLKKLGARPPAPPPEADAALQTPPPPPPPPPPEPEAEPEKPEPAPPPPPTEEEKRAERANLAAVKLVLADYYDAAYRAVRAAEKQAPGGEFLFPSAALRLLASPELAAEGNVAADLEAALKHCSGEPAKIAVFAAALFPAVFFFDGRELFQPRGPLDGFGGERLAALRARVCDFGTWGVTPAVFASAGGGGEDSDARADLAAWYNENKDKTIKYAGATHIWKEWMKKEGVLGAVMLPLLQRPSGADLAAAEHFLHGHRNDKDIGRLIETGAGQYGEKKIEGGAKHRMYELFKEGAALLEKAAEAARESGADDGSDVLREKCRLLLEELARAKESQPPEGADTQTLAAEKCLLRAFGFFAKSEPARITKAGKTQ